MISFRQREKVEKFKFIRHYTIQINPTLLTLKSYPFRVSYTPIYERRIYILTIQGGPNKKFVCSRRRRKERPKERAALRQQRRFECALSGSLCGLQLHFGKTKRADLLLAKTLKDRATSQVRAPVVALGPVHHNCKQKRAKKLFLYISICTTTTTATTTTRKVANQK